MHAMSGPEERTNSLGEGSVRPGTDGKAPWWRHLAVVLLLVALTRVGLYAAGVVAMLIVLTDLRRHPYARLGGTLAIAWWTFAWARSSVPPLIGLGLMLLAAGAFSVAAAQQRHRAPRVAVNAVLAVVALALALLNVVPYGTKPSRLTNQEALASALAASRNDVRATDAQVVRTRERFTQRPVFLVLLFERNAKAATTRDGEPCFRRGEVHIVDGITAVADERGLVDRLTLAPGRYHLAEAREKDGNCLPLPRGTRRDIVPIPGR